MLGYSLSSGGLTLAVVRRENGDKISCLSCMAAAIGGLAEKYS